MPLNYYDEIFYFDEKEKEFFIIALFDDVLLKNDDTFEFQYTDQEKEKLIGKLKRLEDGENSI